MRPQRILERAHGEGAGEVVDIAVALGLAEDRDDTLRVDAAIGERGFERRDVVGRGRGEAMDEGCAGHG